MTTDPHQRHMMRVAKRQGFEVSDVTIDADGHDHVTYTWGGRSIGIMSGCYYPDLTEKVDALCRDKGKTKALLGRLDIPTPRSWSFAPGSDLGAVRTELERFMTTSRVSGGRYVCKPEVGAHGCDVIMGLETVEELMARIERGLQAGAVIIEEQVQGRDVRMHVIGRKVVAVCRRRPAWVVGDGRSTIALLIAEKAKIVAGHNPQNRLEADDETLRLLADRGLSLDDVPAAGEEVPVKRIANISTGGTAIDVTDTAHPGYGEWARRIGDALDLDIFAIDVIAPDERADPLAGAAVVLEVNSAPQWLHHTFSERRTHDIAGMVLCFLFDRPYPLE